MKVLLVLFSLFGVSCLMAQSEVDWNNLSKDLCSGLNKSFKNVSAEMKSAIIYSVDTGTPLDEVFTALASEDMVSFTQQIENFEKAGDKMQKKNVQLRQKYDFIYTSNTSSEISKQLMLNLEVLPGCDFASAFFEFGLMNMKAAESED